jgi:hypothetical protein
MERRLIEVSHPEDNAWYNAYVVDIDKSRGLFMVKIEDPR